MGAVRPSRTPSGLGTEGAALWRDVAGEMADDGLVLDARERRWLLDACREADLIADLSAALKGAPRLIRGSQGQDVINPLISEVRQHRQVVAGLLARVRMDDPREASSGGTGTGSRTTSTMARAAALSRTYGRGTGA